MEFNTKFDFQAVVYGELEKYNEVLSKARCRIFYKYGNRNGSYITDEFAEKLIDSLPYTPIKGIFDNFNDDYKDHGRNKVEGRIYGIVPSTPNVSWEEHVDEDNIKREYLCTDVLLFTGIYKEAYEIIGKPQSMEIYEPSIKGNWMTIDGQKYFVFTDGCFQGLQVLGEDVEPCFEGASFFNLCENTKQLLEMIQNYEKNHEVLKNDNRGGKNKMDKFKLSDEVKYNLIFDQLNPNYYEDYEIRYMITDVFDDYAVAFNFEEKSYERIYYTKNEDDTVTLGDRVKCFIVDVTETEKQALQTIQALNGGTYECLDEKVGLKSEFKAQLEESENKITVFEQKIEEYDEKISTLEKEKEESNSLYSAAEGKIEELTNQINELTEFKTNAELSEKEQIIDKYTTKLNEETLNEYREKIGDFTAHQLSMELAYAYVNATPSIFTKTAEPVIIPTGSNHKSSIEQLLDRYENR